MVVYALAQMGNFASEFLSGRSPKPAGDCTDRVWRETEAALAGPNPRMYFEALRACDALARNAALGNVARDIARIEHFTGRNGPNVAT